ncbi:type VII secretion protein EccCa [Corynebacterium tapiri]|uniref:Type VII secretion protein EccCa n=1 Tax=Corynebacterium tapiri TaxID=1448266 RepID=A0A5C4U4M2_9CORY|nr:type VII secretion protein EccCa [Corynebacterium tapiri]TNL98521.1 type VII secretion protein EccCa [Corynebacterium tapiri]
MGVTFATHEQWVVEPTPPSQRDPAPPKPERVITVDAVPTAQRPQPTPVVRILMPVVMVAAVAAMVVLVFAGGRNASPMMLVLPLMMGVSMLMMFAPPQTEGDVDETRRTYLRHLAVVREKALADAHAQRAHEMHRHPDPADLLARVGTNRMWERGSDDPDVLEVRFGLGPAALSSRLDVKESAAPEELEPVCAVSLRATVSAVSTVEQMPISVQLRAFRFLSLSGSGARSAARAMVAQLVTAHGPETVGIVAQGEGWEWLRWLPHAMQADQAKYRILLIDDLATTGTEEFIDNPEWNVIVDLSPHPTASALGVRAETEGLALSVDERLRVYTAAGVEDLGKADAFSEREARIFARAMTRYSRPEGVLAPGAGGLLGLLGIADLSDVAPEVLWSGELSARGRLNVPIGTTESQAPVRLDLKESAHGGMGPHGLIIGATGSGKSELLKSLVAALVATHSPEDLNLVLVDFKGGATFLGCESAPHTSAVITNLENEAGLVDRMYDALSGELNRRQEVLRAAGNFANITDYAAARATRHDLPSLPALVIIVDEFSELLGQHPDFAELFVAIGRLGRSLGVHLLLASQRLEEGKLRGLDSHLSYRIGLKTFSAAESRQVLGVPDAYQLPAQPGAGYLKADAERLIRFQGAYVSGPVPRRVASGTESTGPGQVELLSSVDWANQSSEDSYLPDHSSTVLEEIVALSRAAAQSRGLAAHKVWLDPLPVRIELPDVADAEIPMRPVIGLIDRPYHQRQDALSLDLRTAGGHVAVCGGPQSGKSMTLKTLVAALAAANTTAEVRFYVIDLAGSSLSGLARLPHVAGYAGRGDDETARRIVDEVCGFIDSPENRRTFLVIDGWHAIASPNSGLDDLVEACTRLVADGPAANCHLLVSTPRWSVLRPAMRDLIAHRVELKLTESLDSLVDRKAQEKVPTLPGRSVTSDGQHSLVAFTSSQDVEHIRHTAEKQGQVPVPALATLPALLALESIPHQPGAIALGQGGARLGWIYLTEHADRHLVVLGQSGAGKSTVVSTVMAGVESLGPERARMVILDPRRAHLAEAKDSMVAAYGASSSAITEAIRATVTTLNTRLPGADVTPAQLKERSWWSGPEIVVIIDDLELISESDLHPLLALLPHARDIGLRVIVARKSAGINRALFSGFLSALRAEQPSALVMDTDRDDGQIFGVRCGPQPTGRGVFVSRGNLVGLTQIARRTEEVQ